MLRSSIPRLQPLDGMVSWRLWAASMSRCQERPSRRPAVWSSITAGFVPPGVWFRRAGRCAWKGKTWPNSPRTVACAGCWASTIRCPRALRPTDHRRCGRVAVILLEVLEEITVPRHQPCGGAPPTEALSDAGPLPDGADHPSADRRSVDSVEGKPMLVCGRAVQ